MYFRHRKEAKANILYIALDRPKAEVMWDLKTYGWKGDDWEFIDLSPGAKQEQSRALTWRTDATNLLSHNLIRKINETKQKTDELGRKLTLDSTINSLTSMILNSDLTSVLAFLNEYTMAIRGTNGLHFLVLVKGVHGIQIEQILSHYADVVLEFSTERKGKEYVRMMGIKKMRGTTTPPNTLFPLEFTKKGVLPSTTDLIR